MCALFVMASALWNEISLDICVATSLLAFQKVLKTWQFSKTLGYEVEAPAGLGGITSSAVGFCGLLFYFLIIIVIMGPGGIRWCFN